MGKFDFDDTDMDDMNTLVVSDDDFESYSGSAAGLLITLGLPILEKVLKYLSKDHGSKVKAGDYADSKIALFDDKVCIISKEKSAIILLTRDTVSSCTFSHEKFRVKKMKTYYYYDIVLNDSKMCQIRVSEKYREALLRELN